MNAITVQSSFAAALLEPGLEVPSGLRVAAGINPARRFAVHRNNAVVALVDALATAFPVTQALVGVDFFRAMARERVRVDPPRSPIINDYCAGFAAFIADFMPVAGLPYLADVSRLEYLRMQAFHAADVEPLDLAAYHALLATPERIAATRVALHPACAWLQSRHAVLAIWSAHQGIDDLADADLAAFNLDTPQSVLVTRPQTEVRVDLLPYGSAAWLDALRRGVPLGGLPQADRRRDTPASALETLLVLLIQHRLVVALHPPTE